MTSSKIFFQWISMGLMLYSCGHILGPHEPIPTKFGVWRFFIMLYRTMKTKSWKCWKIFLMTSHFGALYPHSNSLMSDLSSQEQLSPEQRLNFILCNGWLYKFIFCLFVCLFYAKRKLKKRSIIMRQRRRKVYLYQTKKNLIWQRDTV